MTPPSSAADLPATLPVFPLGGAILLPRALLPLNIFEPRYLAMVRDAMAGDRIIGIVQPRGDWRGERPDLFGIGGVGRITQFSETGDGRFLIALTGLMRFRVRAELSVTTPYRQVQPDYADFAADWSPPAPLAATARAALEDTLRSYLDNQGLSADWEAISSADDESLVNTLATVCPFDSVERQALVEAPTLAARTATLTTLMTFAQGPEDSVTLQ
ncbi:LON peptidase substrate-binding domain-containing protein [Sandaracinobacteroides saxicola]|uniref:LON peptidase substrate-binding domain-containing protein n=1 Tax=Sandaracinobacteroides saxicola TaxID=2759707 RepID=A0A7G5IK82_9SPHN|nr:LON peptidase substrate-binding domain-containing protein [Sandaracinobacteroides saxicola]QMW23774.1 LON peptidase substrate-binding domain-containing protein [Sandaracinobacteroides saxicola]